MKKLIIATFQNLTTFPPGTVYYGDSEFAVEAEEAEVPVIKSKKYEADIAADGKRTEKFKKAGWRKAIKPPKSAKEQPVKAKVTK